jgi:hypothetical protein
MEGLLCALYTLCHPNQPHTEFWKILPPFVLKCPPYSFLVFILLFPCDLCLILELFPILVNFLKGAASIFNGCGFSAHLSETGIIEVLRYPSGPQIAIFTSMR